MLSTSYGYLDPVTVPGFYQDTQKMWDWLNQYFPDTATEKYAQWMTEYFGVDAATVIYSWGKPKKGYTWLLVLGGALILGLLIFKPKKR
jgi:hypothetical protein